MFFFISFSDATLSASINCRATWDSMCVLFVVVPADDDVMRLNIANLYIIAEQN